MIIKKEFIVAIPARLESSRLPRKVLEEIGGKPMIKIVLEICADAVGKNSVVLCTDSKELKSKSEDWGFKVIMTSKSCESGSQRIASVIDEILLIVRGKRLDELDDKTKKEVLINTGIINVQGDQPFLDPKILLNICNRFRLPEKSPSVITPIYPLKSKDIHNPNVVKTLVTNRGKALYFSRSAIPHVRDVKESEWYKYNTYWGHVGIYGYRADVLNEWKNLDESKLESLEKLEQLKLIDSGYEVDTIFAETDSFSIDTKEQLEEARLIYSKNLN